MRTRRSSPAARSACSPSSFQRASTRLCSTRIGERRQEVGADKRPRRRPGRSRRGRSPGDRKSDWSGWLEQVEAPAESCCEVSAVATASRLAPPVSRPRRSSSALEHRLRRQQARCARRRARSPAAARRAGGRSRRSSGPFVVGQREVGSRLLRPLVRRAERPATRMSVAEAAPLAPGARADGLRTSCSPWMCSGTRLVASTLTLGRAREHDSRRRAAAGERHARSCRAPAAASCRQGE